MNDTDIPQKKQLQTSVKLALSVLPCLFFLYINGVMVFALFKRPLLLESSRYILFAHLLFIESVQLIVAILLYMFAATMVSMMGYTCILVIQIAEMTVKLSPLNLAVMSLERYVAISFPLRHATISTPRMTGVAIVVIWTLAFFDTFSQIFVFAHLETKIVLKHKVCTKNSFYQMSIHVILDRVFVTVNFVLVSVVIIYTYVAVMTTVKSSSESSTRRAQKTLLLHLFQLCLCLISTMFTIINSSGLYQFTPSISNHMQYILFLGVIILPKCLSPLIYGLRDDNLKHSFKYCFTFGCSHRSTLKSCQQNV